MSPPTLRPRLNRLDPDQLGDAVVLGVRVQAGALGLSLPDCDAEDLASDVRVLTRWAQGDDALALRMVPIIVERIAPPVYLVPSEPPFGAVDALPNDWRGQVEVVIRAAGCRARIERGQWCVRDDLACLCSMSSVGLRQAIATGRLREEHGRIAAAEAIRWLELKAGQ